VADRFTCKVTARDQFGGLVGHDVFTTGLLPSGRTFTNKGLLLLGNPGDLPGGTRAVITGDLTISCSPGV